MTTIVLLMRVTGTNLLPESVLPGRIGLDTVKYSLTSHTLRQVPNKVNCVLFAQAKLFLDHKTLYWDVDPFMFYVMCEYVKNPKTNLHSALHARAISFHARVYI